MDKDALNSTIATVPGSAEHPPIDAPPSPDPAAVDDGDEEDGRL
ncbi:MAG TPA: hypothetical protein VGN33_02085 [Leifsonia sp.]|jgi:hypothetical protein|nr:hypothetical protein [Leifsonia sp.]